MNRSLLGRRLMRLGERIARNGEIIVVAVSGLLVLAAVMFASKPARAVSKLSS